MVLSPLTAITSPEHPHRPKPAKTLRSLPADEINTPNQREILHLASLTCRLCIAAGHGDEEGSPVGKLLLCGIPHNRHAAVSTWLNATGNPAQVAEWAGHTVDVLMRVYARCVAGQQDEAKRRILEATTPSVDAPPRPRDDNSAEPDSDGEPEP
jgi:hypothetical protein